MTPRALHSTPTLRQAPPQLQPQHSQPTAMPALRRKPAERAASRSECGSLGPLAPAGDFVAREFRTQKQTLKSLWSNKHSLTFQFLNLCMVILGALISWKAACAITGSESPVVVVLSGSMEPGMARGDILVLDHPSTPIQTGEIVVYRIQGKQDEIPIVHRVLQTHMATNGTEWYLTKGDNNAHDDRWLYPPGQVWLSRDDVLGRARVLVPYAGMLTIWLTDYPALKFGLLGIMALYVFTTKE